MRVVITSMCIIICLAFSTHAAHAQFGQRDVKTRLAQDYIKKTLIAKDVQTEIQNELDSLMPSLMESLGSDDPKAARKMRETLVEIINAVDFQTIVVESLIETYSEEEIRAMTEFSSTPVGRVIQRKSFGFSRALRSKMEASMKEIMPSIIQKLIEEASE